MQGGLVVPLSFIQDAKPDYAGQTTETMIAKEIIEAIASEYLADTPLTLVKVKDAGVTIDDCVALSRHIESKLDRDKEDFSLTVGSARRKTIGPAEDED